MTVLLYRLLLSFFAAFALARTLARDGAGAARKRLSPGPAPEGRFVWLHGASNGELASVQPLLERLVAARPDLRWLVTSNTETGVTLADSWGLPGVEARLAPLDLRRPTARLMRDWQVCAHITLESELWPNRFVTCPGPVLLLGARMTEGTARTWGRFPRLARTVLSHVTLAAAQDSGSAERLIALGLPPSAGGPVTDLKAFFTAPLPPDDSALDAAFPVARTWLAASTHDGDDTIVLSAHALCLKQIPDLRLILAPRHARRAESIAAEAAQMGLTTARRSLGEAPGTAQVYIADTMGEMPLWYARAGRVFIGGTLSDRGGHTPYEPAAYGAALLHGPDTRNFAAAYTRLATAGASLEIHDAEGLAQALLSLDTPDAQQAAGDKATAALRQDTSLDSLATALLNHLPRP
ncbi:3-deoxy-D-manno-octulosonic acid transferase [Antarctobacter heliothermus]|uniref:3-deoxy-D-manno-octulosonic acid transferase n=1 Tax=Antarctobacter heliothermus TaxID=74033 RepID=A0A239CKV1_9RHOB|nr:glycosyltransferase N-terminal domain-containing protein [Antarctobacter heliothermus]SNS20104.1 3-deoxy-D-manno-octulosonic-acid transferase [Antarctobacter heliothermus]